MSTKPISFSTSGDHFGDSVPLILGLLGAALGVVFVLAHWSFAIFCGIAIVAGTAFGRGPFLFSVLFFIPISWFSGGTFAIGGVSCAAGHPHNPRVPSLLSLSF